MIAYGVQMITNVWDRQYDLGVKGQSKIYIKLSCQLILYFDGGYSYLTQYLFDGGYSYLTQYLSEVCS